MGRFSVIKRLGLGLGAGALSTGAVVAGSAGAAQATPIHCSYFAQANASPEYAAALCTAGNGQFRAVGTCRHLGSNYTRYGNWYNANPSNFSRAFCNSGDSIYSADLQTRN